MAAKQSLTQTQRQVQITTQMQVMLAKKLEMNANEIAEDVQRELDENAALEVVADPDDQQNRTEDGDTYNESADQLQDNDYGDPDDRPLRPRYRGDDDTPYEAPQVYAPTVSEYLMGQLHEQELTPLQLQIAQYVVDNIDDDGYLRRSVQSITDDLMFKEGLDVNDDQVAEVRDLVRSLDPPGIAAADLRDCLLLQINELKGRAALVAYRVIDECFDDYVKHNDDRVMAALGIDGDTLAQVKKVIHRLQPKPVNAFALTATEAKTAQVTPDFEVTLDDDTLHVRLLNNVPELQIAQSYVQEYDAVKGRSSKGQNAAAASIRDSYDRASAYIELLRRRQEKLFTVMDAIVKRQRDYFFSGDPTQLRPLVLRDIAADTGLDESTLSRTTRNKWVDTPWGIKPLKFFLNKAVGDVAAHKIHDALKQIVEAEDKTQPLTDEQLCDALRQHGYPISRRTVSKYRDLLSIPAASKRKTK